MIKNLRKSSFKVLTVVREELWSFTDQVSVTVASVSEQLHPDTSGSDGASASCSLDTNRTNICRVRCCFSSHRPIDIYCFWESHVDSGLRPPDCQVWDWHRSRTFIICHYYPRNFYPNDYRDVFLITRPECCLNRSELSRSCNSCVQVSADVDTNVMRSLNCPDRLCGVFMLLFLKKYRTSGFIRLESAKKNKRLFHRFRTRKGVDSFLTELLSEWIKTKWFWQ